MSDTPLPYTPDAGQPPNPFIDPRNWAMALGLIGPILAKWGIDDKQREELAMFAAAVVAFAVYLYGQYRSRQRTKVVRTSLIRAAHTEPSQAANLPNPK